MNICCRDKIIQVSVLVCIVTSVGIVKAMKSAPILPQSGSISGQNSKTSGHYIPVPPGYIDLIPPNSPASKFWSETQTTWRNNNITPPVGVISTLVKQSDLATYYGGGPNPFNGHYCYISFSKEGNPSSQLETLRKNIIKIQSAIDGGFSETENIITQLKSGEAHHLGMIRNWKTGFIFGSVVRLDFVINGKPIRKTKLMLTGTVYQPRGIYLVYDISLIQGEPEFDLAVTRLESLSKQIAVANSQP